LTEWNGSELELKDKRKIKSRSTYKLLQLAFLQQWRMRKSNYYNTGNLQENERKWKEVTEKEKNKKKKVQKWKSGTELKVSCRKVKRKRKSQLQKSKKKNKKSVAEM